jgi:hypothetical protein
MAEEEETMDWLLLASKVIIALGLLNVWLLRAHRPTAWRGLDAQNMREEFAAYGLPSWALIVVGFLKVGLALLLLASLRWTELGRPSAAAVAVLMAGAVAMHLKVGDPLKKSVPALVLLGLCGIVIFL